MKYISLGIAALIFVSCGRSEDPKTTYAKKEGNTIKENTPMTSIEGVWTVKRYVFSRISAMDNNMAEEWVNKRLIIQDIVEFSFQEISSYKDAFPAKLECGFYDLKKPRILPTSEVFDLVREPLTELGITKSSVAVYQTLCTDGPFSELILNDHSEIIILWDGVYFVLVKNI